MGDKRPLIAPCCFNIEKMQHLKLDKKSQHGMKQNMIKMFIASLCFKKFMDTTQILSHFLLMNYNLIVTYIQCCYQIHYKNILQIYFKTVLKLENSDQGFQNQTSIIKLYLYSTTKITKFNSDKNQ